MEVSRGFEVCPCFTIVSEGVNDLIQGLSPFKKHL